MSTEVVDPPDDVEDTATEEAVEDQPGFVSVGKLEYDAMKANAEYLQAIADAEEACNEAELVYANAKREADKAKKAFEHKVGDLRELIRTGPKKPNPQMLLPGLDGEQQPDDSYLDESIFTVLELTDKQKEKLEECGVKTVRDFEKLRSGALEDYPKGLRSIRGVGETTADKWENEILAFITKNTPMQSIAIGIAEDTTSNWEEPEEDWEDQ
ncbi:hypothetical protein VN12_04145 [Pirellula sp. SH-Sr6A]|uniref:hypothetical protein n=1 Tax=Pirellula sp. SH-Sr6A TaxID=1632865 RepID=UPI00078B516C|nr:hypothetical protein [Pirellula sp. SH-Sr6A]AMV31284.1 hypothetical protein VN12_04145 [Pirellula sp. SH-Sr6A]